MPDCYLLEAKLPGGADLTKAAELAHQVVVLKSFHVADSSLTTYASSLHRFVKFGQDRLGVPPHAMLPTRPGEVVPQSRVELFIAYAADRYKPATIDNTLSALIDWHRSKRVSSSTVSNPDIKALMARVKRLAGPAGLPKGKTGLTKAMLRLVLCFVDALRTEQPASSPLYDRDDAWIVLGFFGLFRRSELVDLQMRDVELVEGHLPHIRVTIRRSKTDQRGAGATVFVTPANDGIDIWRRVKGWIVYRRGMGATASDPLFTPWRSDTLDMGNRHLASGQTLAERLKHYLFSLKDRCPELSVNPSSYGMHSLRRGGTVAAWESGQVDLVALAAHGSWRSWAIKAYLDKPSPRFMLGVSGNM